jgi:hypothetical protein
MMKIGTINMKIVSLYYPPFHEWFALCDKEKEEKLKENYKESKRKFFAYESEEKNSTPKENYENLDY